MGLDKNFIGNLEELFQYKLLTKESMEEIEESSIITTELKISNDNEDYLLICINQKINGSSAFLYKIKEQNLSGNIYLYQRI